MGREVSVSALAALVLSAVLAAAPPGRGRAFTITVVDEKTGRGVPLVELRTVHGVRLITDSAGVAVFDEPGLLGLPVFFHVRSPGYEMAADGFGYRGRSLRTAPGGKAQLRIRRINIAERLYRVTGAGLYRDSVLAGRAVPLKEPLLNGQVLGSDSVLNAVYRGKLYWFWGDTNRPAYPLGNFQTTGATSQLPGQGGLDPGQGVDLCYFVDQGGFARPMAPMPAKGPTWLTSVVVLPDKDKRERLYASYVKVKPPLSVHARGLAVFRDDKGVFEPLGPFPLDAPAWPAGHTFQHGARGKEHVYFASPFPLVRIRARAEDFRRQGSYEAFTCLRQGSRLDKPRIDRDRDGKPRYAWRKDAPPLGQAEAARLIAGGHLKEGEALVALTDRDTGKAVRAHAGSVYWNAWRRRWVLLAVQQFGKPSLLGEVWYAEADTPTGPWAYAVKVATHPRYSFYNPKHHPLFDQAGGRVIYFEGTYSHTFSGNEEPAPRYDYNQLMYRLDLADPRLALPAAVWGLHGAAAGRPAFFTPVEPEKIAFFALDRPGQGTVPVFAEREKGKLVALRVGKAANQKRAFFHALPAGKDAPGTVPLYGFTHQGGGRQYIAGEGGARPGYQRSAAPLCRVWRNPWRSASR
jgi:hypothetical protein